MHFCRYLQDNAITPFNNAIESHLETLKKQESCADSPNQSAIEKFDRLKEKYEQQRIFIYGTTAIGWLDYVWFLSSAGTVLEHLERRMLTLKYSGASLRKIFDEIKKSGNNYQYKETQILSKNLLKL